MPIVKEQHNTPQGSVAGYLSMAPLYIWYEDGAKRKRLGKVEHVIPVLDATSEVVFNAKLRTWTLAVAMPACWNGIKSTPALSLALPRYFYVWCTTTLSASSH